MFIKCVYYFKKNISPENDFIKVDIHYNVTESVQKLKIENNIIVSVSLKCTHSHYDMEWARNESTGK